MPVRIRWVDGDGVILTDDWGGMATVRLGRDDPTGIGPVSVATLSGPAFAAVAEEHWWPAMWRETCGVLFPCFVGPHMPDLPWLRLVCDTCSQGRDTCAHVRAVLETMPSMEGQVGSGCRRLAAWPTIDVRGMVVTDGAHLGMPDTCLVCLDPLDASISMRCGRCRRSYHRACVEKWLWMGDRCPACRAIWPVEVKWIPLWAVNHGGSSGVGVPVW